MIVNLKPETLKTKFLYENHCHFHEGDSGLDLFFPETVILQPRETLLVDFQIKIDSGQSYWLIPRSSISKTPLRMSNSIGLIDKNYRGNIKVSLDNISEFPYTISADSRLFQIVSPGLEEIYMKIVNNLTETTRGEGGFGSTGL